MVYTHIIMHVFTSDDHYHITCMSSVVDSPYEGVVTTGNVLTHSSHDSVAQRIWVGLLSRVHHQHCPLVYIMPPPYTHTCYR